MKTYKWALLTLNIIMDDGSGEYCSAAIADVMSEILRRVERERVIGSTIPTLTLLFTVTASLMDNVEDPLIETSLCGFAYGEISSQWQDTNINRGHERHLAIQKGFLAPNGNIICNSSQCNISKKDTV